MIKKIGWVVVVFVVLIAGTIGKNVGTELMDKWGKPAPPVREQTQAKIAEAFKTAADQANQRGPVMVDEETRMDRVEPGPGAHITYFYSLPRLPSADVRPSDVKVGSVAKYEQVPAPTRRPARFLMPAPFSRTCTVRATAPRSGSLI